VIIINIRIFSSKSEVFDHGKLKEEFHWWKTGNSNVAAEPEMPISLER